MMKKKKSNEEGKSIWWVVGMAMLLIGYIGWACAASKYSVDVSDIEPMSTEARVWYVTVIDLLVYSVIQIPNFFSVLKFAFQNQIWLIIIVAILELMMLLAGLGMKRLEKRLSRS